MLQKDVLRVHVIVLQHLQLSLEGDDFIDLTALIILFHFLFCLCLIHLGLFIREASSDSIYLTHLVRNLCEFIKVIIKDVSENIIKLYIF